MTLAAAVFLLAVLGASAPLLVRVAGRNAAYWLALGTAASGVLVGVHVPAVLDGEVVQWSAAWIPSAGIELALRLDGLALLFAALVIGIGVLVLAYTARYAEHGDARLLTVLMLFAAAMLGIVLADDLVLLFVAWELTSITSFLLIGGDGTEGRRPAMRALLTTALGGGVALLGGVLVIAAITGTYDLGETLASADAIAAAPLGWLAALLLALAAFTKSAQWPFHFWLPGAMVAPTPVSTYLHAATMVKAGIYLAARFTPVFAETQPWTALLVVIGLVTALVGAVRALVATDLKALLAHSTVSTLGFLTALIGLGGEHGIVAAMTFTVAHALYKSTLFMVTGVIDHEAGTRDLDRLGGLHRSMPWTAGVLVLGTLSMAGIPPLLGYVAKEELLVAFRELAGHGILGMVALVTVVVAAALTVAYSLRILAEVLSGEPVGHAAPASFLAPPAIVAVLGLVLGFGASLLDGLVSVATTAALAERHDVHLSLWHGVTAEVALSGLAIVVGVAIVAARRGAVPALRRRAVPLTGDRGFDATYDAVLRSGSWIARPFLTTSPASHIAWVLGAIVVIGVATTAIAPPGARSAGAPSTPADWVVTSLLAAVLIAMIITRDRFVAAVLLGLVGFILAAWYVVLGAPDLALTQLLIETLTVVLVVLVFSRLERRFARTARLRRRTAIASGAVVGVLAGAAAWTFTGRERLSEPGRWYLDNALEETGGHNVVNTILVDFRAIDTLGEITVVAVAGIGAYALLYLAGRPDR